MSKQKPLPPQKVPPLTVVPPLKQAPSYKEAKPETFEHDAIFCPAREDAFAETAIQMEKAGWELVSVVPQQRHVSNSNGSGMMQGWMTFWKRVKKEEKTS